MSPLDTPLSNIRLLIVEDEPLIALMVEDFAEELGCTSFQTVATEQQALSVIKSFSPQMALLDVTLSRAGPEFLVADALDDALIPFIICSGHHSDSVPYRHKGREYLAKPFSLDELRVAILKLRSTSATLSVPT